MNSVRIILFLLGPLPIIVCSWSVARWVKPSAMPVAISNTLVFDVDAGDDDHPMIAADAARSGISDDALDAACRRRGEQIASRLGDGCRHIVRTPFVIAGDLSTEALDRWYGQTIEPAARALWENYFEARPDEPIVVLLFNREDSYNRYARALFGDEGISIFGYYKPRQRTLVMNISTGGGTLLHELTHALADFDFPNIPDWFNEGLASLHEQARLSNDPPRIVGLTNWRLPVLRDAIRRDRLGSLKELIAADDFRGANEGVNYAQARYFCLYMQEQGVLGDYYRAFHANRANDPTGAKAVSKVFSDQSWQQLEEAFRQWVARLDDAR